LQCISQKFAYSVVFFQEKLKKKSKEKNGKKSKINGLSKNDYYTENMHVHEFSIIFDQLAFAGGAGCLIVVAFAKSNM
jgi:hypothetical protein